MINLDTTLAINDSLNELFPGFFARKDEGQERNFNYESVYICANSIQSEHFIALKNILDSYPGLNITIHPLDMQKLQIVFF